MLMTTAIFAGSDAMAKLIGTTMPLLAMLWFRYLFQALTLGALLVKRAVWPLRFAGPMRLQILRAMLLLANSACTFAGLRHLPLPVTTALAMMAPLFTTLLAATLLGEQVRLAQWVAVAAGFAGMLLIVRPGSDGFSWAVCFPIGSAISFACLQVVSSRLSKGGDAFATNFLTALLATLALTCLALADQAALLAQVRLTPWSSWALLLLMATLATSGQITLLEALRRAPLSVLTPFTYTQLVFAALLGWLIFGRVPDSATALGIGVIAASGMATIVARRAPKIAR
ncbi:DMT family transporter [Paraburkholderia sp. MMS20-SJTR3]|uniref:DMT family transporter n=1 Tax=Paraburkholderia sejongensis TaxID=2886946 RepID=A0ABS8K1B9_9BURK|nr:DMT family transporter [Paraburkholderia sp. MMS20-SJTR3]MCC8395927.1 DMT family transporter [Paraburkholderia sp. MMS20-SJTR3]